MLKTETRTGGINQFIAKGGLHIVGEYDWHERKVSVTEATDPGIYERVTRYLDESREDKKLSIYGLVDEDHLEDLGADTHRYMSEEITFAIQEIHEMWQEGWKLEHLIKASPEQMRRIERTFIRGLVSA